MLFVLLGAGAFLLASMLGWQAWKAHKRIRRIVSTPTTPMDRITEGPIEVAGVVSTLSSIVESPLSKFPCVWWELHVEEYTGGKNKSWKTRLRKYGSGTLLLEDDTGACQIALERIEFVLEPDSRVTAGMFNSADAELKEALARFGFDTESWLFNKKIRCTETYLEVGDKIYALGYADSRSGDFPLVTHTAEHPLLISDLSEAALLAKTYNKRLLTTMGAGLLALGAMALLSAACL